jgi:hypothetical protein
MLGPRRAFRALLRLVGAVPEKAADTNVLAGAVT